MASYIREGDRHGLPSIRKHGFLDTQPSPRRITTIENDVLHRVRSTSPGARMFASDSSLQHPRPPSPNRRQVTEVRGLCLGPMVDQYITAYIKFTLIIRTNC